MPVIFLSFIGFPPYNTRFCCADRSKSRFPSLPEFRYNLSENTGVSLQSGMLAGSIFPRVLIVTLFLLTRQVKKG